MRLSWRNWEPKILSFKGNSKRSETRPCLLRLKCIQTSIWKFHCSVQYYKIKYSSAAQEKQTKVFWNETNLNQTYLTTVLFPLRKPCYGTENEAAKFELSKLPHFIINKFSFVWVGYVPMSQLLMTKYTVFLYSLGSSPWQMYHVVMWLVCIQISLLFVYFILSWEKSEETGNKELLKDLFLIYLLFLICLFIAFT